MSVLVATHSTFTLCICAFYGARTSWISEPVQAFHFKITATHAICFAELAEVHHNDILMTLAIRLLTGKTWQNCHSSWNEPWTVPDVTSSAKTLATQWPTRISVRRFHWLEHYAADLTDFLLCRWSLYPRKASCPRNEAVIGNNRQLGKWNLASVSKCWMLVPLQQNMQNGGNTETSVRNQCWKHVKCVLPCPWIIQNSKCQWYHQIWYPHSSRSCGSRSSFLCKPLWLQSMSQGRRMKVFCTQTFLANWLGSESRPSTRRVRWTTLASQCDSWYLTETYQNSAHHLT